MNIKRVIKRSNLEKLIVSFTKTTPLSLCIKDKNKKPVLVLPNPDKELSFNYPITFSGKTVAELSISENGQTFEFILIDDIRLSDKINEKRFYYSSAVDVSTKEHWCVATV